MPRNHRIFALDEHRWPSGIARSAAMFSTTPEAVTARTGVAFESGVDDLDYFRAAGVELPSGRRVLLLWYERAPVLGLQLEIDSADDPAAARSEAMAALDLASDEVMWSPNDGAAAS